MIRISFIILINFCFLYSFSQEHTEEGDSFTETGKNWNELLDYSIDHPELLVNPDLRLLSYETTEIPVMNFLTKPMDSLQYIPRFNISEEMQSEMHKDNYEMKSGIKLIPFSELSLAEQYAVIGKKVYTLTLEMDQGKELKIVRLNWKYKGIHFTNYCLIVNQDISYNVIFSNITQIKGRMSTTLTIDN